MNALAIALSIYKTFGRESAKRFLTPPRKWIEQVCTKSGANVEKAIEERNEAVEETLEFIESLIDQDFEDPDQA